MGKASGDPFGVQDIAHFDGEALRIFLDPRDGGVDPRELGRALQFSDNDLTRRIADALPDAAARRFLEALASPIAQRDAERARHAVVTLLFWPLVYWNRPDDYEELISGEHIGEEVLAALDLTDRVVCDIGAGTGRFTLLAAGRARSVIAVDAVPEMLRRLEAHAAERRFANIATRRGSFDRLPLVDRSVDIAVACSSFTTSGPHGGDRAVREAQRIVRSGGRVGVIWPPDPAWFIERGFVHVNARGDDTLHFRDVETAERLCRSYYSEAAARWVLEHRSSTVPYAVLGVSVPNGVCIKHID